MKKRNNNKTASTNSKQITLVKSIENKETKTRELFFVAHDKLPAPVQKDAVVKANDRQYVLNGKNNSFVKLANDLKADSTHKSILQKKTNLVCGNGLEFEFFENETEKAKAEDFLSTINEYENADQLIEKIIIDLENLNYCFLEIRKNNKGNGIGAVTHIPADTVAIVAPETRGKITEFAICSDWKNHRREVIEHLPAFNKKELPDKSIFMLSKYDGSGNLFPAPVWEGAIDSALSSISIGRMIRSFVNNNMQIGLHVKISSADLDEKIMAEVYAKIKSIYEGVENTNKVIVTDSGVEISPIPASEMSKLIPLLKSEASTNVAIAHQFPVVLLGNGSGNKLSITRNEFIDATEFFNSTYTNIRQKLPVGFINDLLFINEIKAKKIIKSVTPLSFRYSDETITKMLTLTEMRKSANYDVMPEGEVPLDVYLANHKVQNQKVSKPDTTTKENETTEDDSENENNDNITEDGSI